MGPRLAFKAVHSSLIGRVFKVSYLLWGLLHPLQLWARGYRIIGSIAFYVLLKRLWEPGYWAMHQVVRAYTCFTCLTFIDWSVLVGLFLVVGAVGLLWFCFCFVLWPICAIVLSTDDQFSTISWLPQLLWRAQHWSKKKGLVGNAESTHVNRPKGKATFVQ